MGWLAAHFFAHLQEAGFYRAAHAEAVAMLPEGTGRVWLDLGCGPGLVTRLAAARGYRALGRDIDPAMVALARHIASREGAAVEFGLGALAEPPPGAQCADVVSAASLLFVLEDRAKALEQMLAHVQDDGVVLLVETTSAMRPGNAWRWLMRAGYTSRAWMLLLWAWVRNGRAVDPADLRMPGWHTECRPLLGGLLNAIMLRRASSS